MAALATGVALGMSVVATVPAVATPDVPHAISEPRPGEAVSKDKDGNVLLYVDGRDQKAVRDTVTRLGGKVTGTQGSCAQIAIGQDRVAALGKEQSIVEVERPERAIPMAVTSEGVQASGADGWINDGKKGKDVKVGVIDVGFARLDEVRQSGELPHGNDWSTTPGVTTSPAAVTTAPPSPRSCTTWRPRLSCSWRASTARWTSPGRRSGCGSRGCR